MTIAQLLARDTVTFSCEIFPPKKEEGFPEALRVADAICALGADYVSVTYGAGGSTSKKTVEVAAQIQKSGVPALAHLTCVGADRETVSAQLDRLRQEGIRNVMALRGDPPRDGTPLPPGDFPHAVDLIRMIRQQGDFCIGAACYPEGHPECEHKAQDIAWLKEKADAGCDFLVTQMFFDNDFYYNFLYRALSAGITQPIVPGIMPVINARQIRRSAQLSGAAFPARFRAIVDRFGDDPQAMEQAGVAYATEQIIDLIANGVKTIHLYTMNRPETTRQILSNLSYILRR